MEVQSLNHWATREVPDPVLFNGMFPHLIHEREHDMEEDPKTENLEPWAFALALLFPMFLCFFYVLCMKKTKRKMTCRCC